MTREEQILEAGVYHLRGSRPPKTYGHNMFELAYLSRNLEFEAGAKWADEHPDSKHTYTKQQLIEMGFAFTPNGDIVTPEQENEHLKRYLQYRRGKMIDKAVAWLKDNWRDYIFHDADGMIGFIGWEKDFRKAMEE